MFSRNLFLLYRKLKIDAFTLNYNDRYSHQSQNVIRVYHTTQHMCKATSTVHLLPGVESQFFGGMKHRKHPGVKKENPITLPPKLINAVDRVIPSYALHSLLVESQELMKDLNSRRLPIESDELQEKINNILANYELDDDIDQNLKNKLIMRVKKMVKYEVSHWKPIDFNERCCLVYLVARLATNYATLSKVFSEIKNIVPYFKPKTFLDFGSGVGSATWVAHSLWGDYIKEYFCVDASPNMNDLSQRLLEDDDSENMLLKTVFFRQFLPASEAIKYDLVVSAFSLMELPSAMDRLKVIDTLWRKTTDTLVIIEAGTRPGFSAVLDARDYVLNLERSKLNSGSSSGANVLCPCPHEFACPRIVQEISKAPCGFNVKYHPLFQKRESQIVKNFKYTYVVLRRGLTSEGKLTWPRIVKRVKKRSGHVICGLCCDDGKMEQITLSRGKHGRHAYRCARSSTLGDLLPMTVSKIDEDTENENSSNNEFSKTLKTSD